MGRYKKENRLVDLSPIPLIPMRARETVMTDTRTGRKATALDWKSFTASERKAWEKLKKTP